MKTIERLRWRIAELLNRLPGQCWSGLVDWVLYIWRDDPDLRTAIPWRPIGDMCRRDFAQCGSCYCGKLRTPESHLPRRVGPGKCPTCWVLPGETHDLSCEQVTPEQFRAFLAAQRGTR